jgi:hypothetical protein
LKEKTCQNSLNFKLFSDADATQIFDAFHEGSPSAYKQLAWVEKRNQIEFPGADPTLKEVISTKEINVGVYDLSIEKVSTWCWGFLSLSWRK